jgi:hypothetical protein
VRKRPGEEVVERDTHRIEIALGESLPNVQDHLGGHVAKRARGLPELLKTARAARQERPRQPEALELDLRPPRRILPDEDVGVLDVRVDEPELVGMFQRLERLVRTGSSGLPGSR